MNRLLAQLAILATFCVVVEVRQATADIALTITPSAASSDSDTNGWRFQVLSDIFVTALGTWDENADGLPASIDVGLWTDAGALMSSAVVPAGVGGILDSGFRFTGIAPLLLQAGDFYVVGSSPQTGTVEYQGNVSPPTPLTIASAISFDAGRFASSSNTLTFPANLPASFPEAFFGANFQFEPAQAATVPEPASLALCIVFAVVGVGIGRMRRKQG